MKKYEVKNAFRKFFRFLIHLKSYEQKQKIAFIMDKIETKIQFWHFYYFYPSIAFFYTRIHVFFAISPKSLQSKQPWRCSTYLVNFSS